MKNPQPDFLLIDLFCGAGGTTTGAELSGVCKVIAAVNHDPLAIASHAANHRDVLHLTEDILPYAIAQDGQTLYSQIESGKIKLLQP